MKWIFTKPGSFYKEKRGNMLENKEIKSTYYEVYPESFVDSNKDGIGDLEGVKTKLTIISQLGANYLLLNKIFEEKEDKTTDFYKIKKAIGEKSDLENLLNKAKELRLKVILDIDSEDLEKTYADKLTDGLKEVLKYWQEIGIRGIRLKKIERLINSDEALKEIKNLTDDLGLMLIGEFENLEKIDEGLVDLAYISKANRLIKEKNSYKEFYELIDEVQNISVKIPCGMDLDNLDGGRIIEKVLGHDEEARLLSEAMATLLFSLKSIPFIYQGTEVEAKSEYFVDMDKISDEEIKAIYNSYLEEGNDREEAFNKIKRETNFSSKIPLRWDESILGRFSEVENYYGTLVHTDNNYKEYLKHSDSFFYFLYETIMLRKRKSAFGLGEYEKLFIDESVYAYKRTYKDEAYVVLVNLTDDFYEIDEEITEIIKDGKVIQNNNPDYDPEILDSYQAVIIEL